MAGLASDDGGIRVNERQGQFSGMNSAGLGETSQQLKGPTSHFTSERGSD